LISTEQDDLIGKNGNCKNIEKYIQQRHV